MVKLAGPVHCKTCGTLIQIPMDLYHFQGSLDPAFCSPACMVQYLYDQGKVGVVSISRLL